MTVILSGGRPRHVEAKSYPFRSTVPLIYGASPSIELLRGGISASYEAIVKSQPWVYAAVSRLTFWTARIPLKVYDNELSDDRQRVLDGDLAGLLKRPRPKARQIHVMLEAAWDFYTYGHSLLVKYRRSAGEPPCELWHVPWRFVQQVIDEGDQLVGFNVLIGGLSHGLTMADVVHFSYPRGIAPLEALTRTVQTEDAAMTYQTESLRNGVLPRAAFTSTDKIGDRDVERLRAELTKLYGGAENAGRFALLHSGLSYDKPIGVSPADMALMDQRKLSREEVAAAFDVSPPFLGILDRATFSNVTELREAMYVDSLGPKLELLQATTQAQLVDCEPVWEQVGYYVEHDINVILKPNPEGQARQALMEQQASTTTINERRRRLNLKPIDDPVANTVLRPVNMWPVGIPLPEPAAPAQANARTLTDDLTAEAFRHGAGAPPSEGEDHGD
jgi:HK97 family phage portal protein